MTKLDQNLHFVYGHMTKMAITPIQGKIPSKLSVKSKGLGHGMQNLECGLYQVLTNDTSGLT